MVWPSKIPYLAGTMTGLKSYGIAWRRQIKIWLKERGVECYDPCTEETSEHKKYDLKRIPKHKWEKFPQPLQEEIRDKDLNQICRDTSYIICFFTKYSTGTITELGLAGWKRIPVYMVTTRKVMGWPGTTMGQEGNRIFRTFEELKRFLLVKYSLKRLKNEKKIR